MQFRPTLTTPPAESPVSLEEVKDFCVVGFSDDDDLLTSLRDAAVSHLDGFRGVLGRAMIAQTWAISYTEWRREIVLRVPDVSSVSITYNDADGVEQTATGATIHAKPMGTLVRLPDDFAFPALETDNAAPITVTFTCGFGDADDVPAALKVAVKALTATWYGHRAAMPDKALPMGVEALVAPWRWVA